MKEDKKNIIIGRASLIFVVFVFVFLALTDTPIYLWILFMSAAIFGSALNEQVPFNARRNRFILAVLLFLVTVLVYISSIHSSREIRQKPTHETRIAAVV